MLALIRKNWMHFQKMSESFFKGYEIALRDFFAELAMDKLSESQQIAFLEGYCKAMHEILQELNKLLDC